MDGSVTSTAETPILMDKTDTDLEAEPQGVTKMDLRSRREGQTRISVRLRGHDTYFGTF